MDASLCPPSHPSFTLWEPDTEVWDQLRGGGQWEPRPTAWFQAGVQPCLCPLLTVPGWALGVGRG